MEKIDYTVGDDIVRVGNGKHSKDGEVFKAIGITTSPCGCALLVNIGRQIAVSKFRCCDCGEVYDNNGFCFYAPHFKKLDTIADISELTEVLTTTKPFEV